MLHFSCDLCGKELSEDRYVVQMEVFAAHDPAEITEDDLDDDFLEDMSELLRAANEENLEPTPAYKKMRYDLCAGCHKRFLADPLNRDALKFDFSEN